MVPTDLRLAVIHEAKKAYGSPEHKAAAKRAVEHVRERLGLTREDSR